MGSCSTEGWCICSAGRPDGESDDEALAVMNSFTVASSSSFFFGRFISNVVVSTICRSRDFDLQESIGQCFSSAIRATWCRST